MLLHILLTSMPIRRSGKSSSRWAGQGVEQEMQQAAISERVEKNKSPVAKRNKAA